MTDIPATPARKWKWDAAWIASALIPLALMVFAPEEVWPTVSFAVTALGHTAPFILFAILAVGYLKATNAEALLAKAFEGREVRMIVLAALFGGLSPFCSCEVIPFIAAMLAVGAPLSAVMAFWLASPLMDPAMFAITAGTLGVDFAIAKGIAAVLIGLMGGFVAKALAGSFLFVDPLKNTPVKSCCSSSCGSGEEVSPLSGTVNWRFWQEVERRETFRATAWENAIFLGKWLLLAYLLEALMLRYIPAQWVAQVLGGDGIMPIVLGAFVGAPAYLNGYAAVPMVEALLAQGMSQGAAMSFVIAGGVSCIPAAVAVWALVKPRVFVAYLALAVVGAVLAGLGWSMVAVI